MRHTPKELKKKKEKKRTKTLKGSNGRPWRRGDDMRGREGIEERGEGNCLECGRREGIGEKERRWGGKGEMSSSRHPIIHLPRDQYKAAALVTPTPERLAENQRGSDTQRREV